MSAIITVTSSSGTTTIRPVRILIPPPPVTLPPRKFDEREYRHYRHLPGMPRHIPEITKWHYLSVLVPIGLLVWLYLHHREQSAKDLADEISKTKKIRMMLMVGTVFAGIVVMVHMQIIPPRYVRMLFPRWKQPPTMPKILKIILVFCFLVFVVYPTVKFIRRMNMPGRNPAVHRFLSRGSEKSNKRK